MAGVQTVDSKCQTSPVIPGKKSGPKWRSPDININAGVAESHCSSAEFLPDAVPSGKQPLVHLVKPWGRIQTEKENIY